MHIDYHVIVDKHHYSVPYHLIGKRVDTRWTGSTVEVFLAGLRVACHERSDVAWGWTTVGQHRPQAHQEYLKWTPERIVAWARKTGPETSRLTEQILSAKSHPERGYRACLGVMRFSKKHGEQRLEAACRRALALGSPTYRTVRDILASSADQLELPVTHRQDCLAPPRHDNIRGAEHYE